MEKKKDNIKLIYDLKWNSQEKALFILYLKYIGIYDIYFNNCNRGVLKRTKPHMVFDTTLNWLMLDEGISFWFMISNFWQRLLQHMNEGTSYNHIKIYIKCIKIALLEKYNENLTNIILHNFGLK